MLITNETLVSADSQHEYAQSVKGTPRRICEKKVFESWKLVETV